MKQLLFITQLTFVPTLALLYAMFFSVVLDFLTGCYKARRNGEATTSKGFRKTIDKFVSYGVAIAVACLLSFIAELKMGAGSKALGSFLNDALVILIIYIEIVSIFENLIAVNPDSQISIYFFVPIHKILTLQLKNNPFIIQAQNAERDDVNKSKQNPI